MSKDELIDVYDGTGKYLGTKSRDLVHKDGDWHKTFHCWVIYADESGDGYVILQKRSDLKATWPGYVDITAAGHYLAGETLQEGLRELEEEIGINVSMDYLIPLGTRVCVEEFQVGKINHEFQDVFFLIGDRNLDNYNLQEGELSGLLRVRIDDLLALFSKKTEKCLAEGFILERVGNDTSRKYMSFTITRDVFIPSLDDYNYKIMILAKRALRREKHLRI